MRKSLWAGSLLLILWGCAPLPDSSPTAGVAVTGSPRPPVSATPAQTPEPVVSATPGQPRLPEPDLPAAVLKPLQPVAGLVPKMKDTEVWWADSGISDNRLGYYASDKGVAEIEAELLPTFTDNKVPYIEGVGPVFDFEGNRVCLMKSTDSDLEELFVLVPLADPPVVPTSLRALKLPNISAQALKGHKTLVILATGKGLGEHVDHMLAQAGLVITPTPPPTP